MTLKINRVNYLATGQQACCKRSSGVAIMTMLNLTQKIENFNSDADLTSIDDVAEKIYQKQQRLLRWIECNPKAFAKVNLQEWVNKNGLFVFVRKTLENGLLEIAISVMGDGDYGNQWLYNPVTGQAEEKFVCSEDYKSLVERSIEGYVDLGVVSTFYAQVVNGVVILP